MVKERRVRLYSEMPKKEVKIREPNTLIEAGQKLSREELIIWLWSMLKATVAGKKKFSPEDIEELKRKKEVPVLIGEVDLEELKQYFPDYFPERKIRYYRDILKKMEEKIAFEVNLPAYIETLNKLGFEYLIDKLKIPVPSEKRKIAYYGISVIMSMSLVEESNNKKIQIVYSPYVAPLLLELKTRYTTYDFLQVLKLSSKYSIILYRLIKERLGLRKYSFSIDLEELQKIMDTNYKNWSDFKKKILVPAVKELNEKTNFQVSYKPIRGSDRKVHRVLFEVKDKKYLPAPYEFFKEDIKQIVEDLTKSFQSVEEITPEEFALELLKLKKVNPAVAIWFLLHYPEGESRVYAWQHVLLTEESKTIKHPDKFMQSLIQDKKPEWDWLLDQRTKDLIREELKKVAGEKWKKREELNKLKNQLWDLHFYIRRYEEEIAKKFKVRNVGKYINDLLEKEDTEHLKELIEFVKNLVEENKTEDDDRFFDF